MKLDLPKRTRTKKAIRTTLAFRIMGLLTVFGLMMTLASWLMGKLMIWMGSINLPDGGELVLSANAHAITVGLGAITAFFLAVWIVVAVRKM